MPVQLDHLHAMPIDPLPDGLMGSGAPSPLIDLSMLNVYLARPDYEAMDLTEASGERRKSGGHEWTSLAAKPLLAFEFEFGKGAGASCKSAAGCTRRNNVYACVAVLERHAAPETCQIAFGITGHGMANAVVFYHELVLCKGEEGSDDTIVDNSPLNMDKGATWQQVGDDMLLCIYDAIAPSLMFFQAIQWIPPCEVLPGDVLTLEAHHDTYGISFRLLGHRRPPPSAAGSPHAAEGLRPVPGELPLDRSWASRHAALQPLGASLSKSLAQDPLEYRRLARAAAELAMRPQDHGVDAAQAASFCAKLLSA